MSAVGPETKRAGLLARAAGMLLHPAQTWQSLDDEPATVSDLYGRYVLPLAAVPPLCGALGLLAFGASIAGIHLKLGVGAIVAGAALDYGLALAGVYLLALTVAALAPRFGGTADRVQALKLVAYSGTAMWAAGAFALYPTLGFAMGLLGGLYSLYALYLGLPRLMKAPHETALTYFATVLAAVLLLGVLLRLADAAVF